MRICHIVTSLEMGGMERVVCDLLSGQPPLPLMDEGRGEGSAPLGRRRKGSRLRPAVAGLRRAMADSAGKLRRAMADSAGKLRRAMADSAGKLRRAMEGRGEGSAPSPFRGEGRGEGDSGHPLGYLFCTDKEGALYANAKAQAKACGWRRPRPWVVDWRVVWGLVRFVRAHKIDCLHAHNHVAHLYAVLASLLVRVPVVVTLHGQGYFDSVRTLRLRRWLCRRTRFVVVVSRDAGEVAVRSGTVPREKLVVIPNGVDTRRFRLVESGVRSQESGVRKKLGIPADAVVIGSVGRLAPEKNYPLLVRTSSSLVSGQGRGGLTTKVTKDTKKECVIQRANMDGGVQQDWEGSGLATKGAKSIKEESAGRREECENRQPISDDRPSQSEVCSVSSIALVTEGLRSNVHLLLVGDGPERGRIEAAIRELDLESNCKLVGMQEDVLPWLHAMDIFCLTSDTEGLSMTLLEAGACGLPCVVTDAGGNPEIVEEGVTGRVVAKGDEAALVAALGELAGNEVRRKQMGRAARQRVVDKFSQEAMMDGYEHLYGQVFGPMGWEVNEKTVQ